MFNSGGDGIIIDWENGTPINNPCPTLCLYEVTGTQNMIQEDSIKMFACALSLLYEHDFGGILMCVPINKFFNIIQSLELDPVIGKFLDDFSYELNIRSGRVAYFDDYLKKMKPISCGEIRRVRELAFTQYYNDTLDLGRKFVK